MFFFFFFWIESTALVSHIIWKRCVEMGVIIEPIWPITRLGLKKSENLLFIRRILFMISGRQIHFRRNVNVLFISL